MIYATHKKKFFVDREFQMQPGLRQTWTVKPDGIEKTEDGFVYARKGSFIDKEGKVVTLTGSDSLEFGSDPIGILTETLNLTYGAQAGSVLRSGVIDAQYLFYPEGVEYKPAFNASIEEKLPLIQCYMLPEEE